MQSSLKVIICQSLNLVYEPNNASEDTWLWAETANEKLEQDAKRQDADVMQALHVLYMTHLEAASQF